MPLEIVYGLYLSVTCRLRARALTDTALIPYKKPYNQAGAELPPETDFPLLDKTLRQGEVELLATSGDPWKGSDKFGNSSENA